MISEKQIEVLENELNLRLDNETTEKLNLWFEIFVKYNEHTNLMSSNDINVIFEKHVFDSLAIIKWDKFKSKKMILDVGTGGGFPSVILSICFSDKKIIANDSRIKKINFIKEAKEILKLNNLEICYSRIEEVDCLGADLIVSRAVGKIKDVYELSKKHLACGGDFLIYKSKLVSFEIEEFKRKYKNAKFEIISYNLPLEENFDRNLVILHSFNKA